ncbi:MAG TPA: isochorismatase family cysteine hydrolase [Gaiellaceae bacterium]
MKDALLVVDVVNTFRHEDGEDLLASFRHRLERMTRSLAHARADPDLPVVYANDAFGDWTGDGPRFVRRAIEDGDGGDVVRALEPQGDEPFLFKGHYSAFDSTPLTLVLESLEVERVLLMGASTEGCVVQSAIDARELGLKVTVLTESCATADEQLERVALDYAERVGGVRLAATFDER